MMTRSFSVLKHAALPILLGAFTAILTCAHGVPLLRHDWGLPQAPQALRAAWETTFQPLLLRGLGETNAYPTPYLVGFIGMPLAFLPPAIFTWLFVGLISASAAGAGAALARTIGANATVQSACALFAVLNPWTYTELVAGHVFMVMAYGFVLWFVAESLRPNPRPAWLVLWSALLVCQIEFLTFAFVPVAVWLLLRKHYLALLALCIAVLPIAFGILAHYADIRETPFLLEWQVSQSLDILDALTLRGYFAQYASAFGVVTPALWIAVAAAAVATILGIAKKWAGWPVLLIGWCATIFATGTKWVVAPLYDMAVLHVAEIGVFRELYDLLALSAIAYIVGIAWIGKMHRYASLLLLAACVSLAYPWVASPPFRHFVPQRLVPVQNFPGSDRERVALFPAQQPLKLRGGDGSGYDPDLFYQPGRAVPINSYFPVFPQVGALAAAGAGDFTQISALSVRYVIGRQYLEANIASQRYEMIAPRECTIPPTQTLAEHYPMLGLAAGYPSVVTIGRSPRGDGVFYGDISTSSRVRMISAPRIGTDAKAGWIDARLAYASYPALATRFGGAFTRGKTPLPVATDMRAILASTTNTLRNAAGQIVAHASDRLQWHMLPKNTHELICTGACMVSAIGDPPPLRAEAPAARLTAVDFSWITPWLIRATIPPHSNATLRWNMRYERSWTLLGARTLALLPLDEALNGWVLPAGPSTNAYLINVSAALQIALEICSFFFICALLWHSARHA